MNVKKKESFLNENDGNLLKTELSGTHSKSFIFSNKSVAQNIIDVHNKYDFRKKKSIEEISIFKVENNHEKENENFLKTQNNFRKNFQLNKKKEENRNFEILHKQKTINCKTQKKKCKILSQKNFENDQKYIYKKRNKKNENDYSLKFCSDKKDLKKSKLRSQLFNKDKENRKINNLSVLNDKQNYLNLNEKKNSILKNKWQNKHIFEKKISPKKKKKKYFSSSEKKITSEQNLLFEKKSIIKMEFKDSQTLSLIPFEKHQNIKRNNLLKFCKYSTNFDIIEYLKNLQFIILKKGIILNVSHKTDTLKFILSRNMTSYSNFVLNKNSYNIKKNIDQKQILFFEENFKNKKIIDKNVSIKNNHFNIEILKNKFKIYIQEKNETKWKKIQIEIKQKKTIFDLKFKILKKMKKNEKYSLSDFALKIIDKGTIIFGNYFLLLNLDETMKTKILVTDEFILINYKKNNGNFIETNFFEKDIKNNFDYIPGKNENLNYIKKKNHISQNAYESIILKKNTIFQTLKDLNEKNISQTTKENKSDSEELNKEKIRKCLTENNIRFLKVSCEFLSLKIGYIKINKNEQIKDILKYFYLNDNPQNYNFLKKIIIKNKRYVEEINSSLLIRDLENYHIIIQKKICFDTVICDKRKYKTIFENNAENKYLFFNQEFQGKIKFFNSYTNVKVCLKKEFFKISFVNFFDRIFNERFRILYRNVFFIRAKDKYTLLVFFKLQNFSENQICIDCNNSYEMADFLKNLFKQNLVLIN